MAKNYRTAQGKTIDMSALAAKNEKVRAVGLNMRVNARGDTIDQYNKVVVPVTQKVGEKYQKTVGNKSAQARSKTNPAPAAPPPPVSVQKPKQEPVLTQEELELQKEMDLDDSILEEIKPTEKK
jgi:hypothetical protein